MTAKDMADWPVKRVIAATTPSGPIADANANGNVAAAQLQGYAGTIIECTVCHEVNINSSRE